MKHTRFLPILIVMNSRRNKLCAASRSGLAGCAVVLFLFSCSPPHVRTGNNYRPSAGSEDYERDIPANSGEKRTKVVKTALGYLGTPYKSGGIDPRGFDCSGLSMFVYKKNRVAIARTVAAQYIRGEKVGKKMKAGDLVFFNITGRKVSHVGIYIGRGKFIHAPSIGKNVEVSSLSNAYWRPRFRGAVSYL